MESTTQPWFFPSTSHLPVLNTLVTPVIPWLPNPPKQFWSRIPCYFVALQNLSPTAILYTPHMIHGTNGIFTYIYHKKSTFHVGKYTSPKDGMFFLKATVRKKRRLTVDGCYGVNLEDEELPLILLHYSPQTWGKCLPAKSR